MVYRPNGAFKLLTHLLYGNYPHMQVMPRRIITLQSIRRMARLLGTQTRTVRLWIAYLEDAGYLSSVSYSPNGRSVTFQVREPHNAQ